MSAKDNKVDELFKEIMLHCRAERRAISTRSLREVAKDIRVTENYLSAVENGREVPSLPFFLRYLVVNGFDISVLKMLSIKKRAADADIKEKVDLVNKIYSLDPDQVQFLAEQAKLASKSRIKFKRKR